MPFTLDKAQPLKAQTLLDTEPPKDLFVIEPEVLPRGGFMVLSGYTKAGKSFVALTLIRDLLEGTLPFQCPYLVKSPPLKRVALVEKELGQWSLRKRLLRRFEGVDPIILQERFDIWSGFQNGISLSDGASCNYLKKYCEDEGVDLLVLDPFNRVQYEDQNSGTQMARVIAVIQELQGTRTAVLLIHHNRKPPTGQNLQNHDPLDPYNMSGARIQEAADAILMLDRQEGKVVPATWDNWRLDANLILRHGSSPERFTLDVNVNNQFEVLFSAPTNATRTFS